MKGVIPSQLKHDVEPLDDDTEFYIEFFRGVDVCCWGNNGLSAALARLPGLAEGVEKVGPSKITQHSIKLTSFADIMIQCDAVF